MVGPKLPVAPSDLPAVTGFQRSTEPQGVTSDVVEETLELVRTADEQRIGTWFDVQAYRRSATSYDILLMAIDPSSGDSALHAAAAAGNLSCIRAIRRMFNLGYRTSNVKRVLYLLLTHANKTGDQALHAAARSGHLDCVIALYRLFNHDSLPGEPDMREPGVEFPAEEWTWEADVTDDWQASALVYVTATNDLGHEAIDEARLAGHDHITEWLQSLLDRLDPEGRRRDEGEWARIQDLAKQRDGD